MMASKSRTFSLLLAYIFLLLSFSQCLAHFCKCQCDMSSHKKVGHSNFGSQSSNTGSISGSSGISVSGSGSSKTGSDSGISGSGSSNTGSSSGISDSSTGSGSSKTGSGISGSESSNAGSGSGISGSSSGSSNIGSDSGISGSGSSNTGSDSRISGSGSSSGSSNTGFGSSISGSGSSNTGSGSVISGSGSGSLNTGSGSGYGSGASGSGSSNPRSSSGISGSGSGSSNTGSDSSISGSGSINTGSDSGISGSGFSSSSSPSSSNTGSGSGISGSGTSNSGSSGSSNSGIGLFSGKQDSSNSGAGSFSSHSSNSGAGSFSSHSSTSGSASASFSSYSSISGSLNSTFSNIIAFGDSFTDTGNAALLGGLKGFAGILSPKSPYGSSLSNKTTTPRFSDGRILVDFLSDVLHLPHLAPYQNNSANFSKGVNFAVAGSTIFPGNYSQNNSSGSFMWKNVPESIRNQLDWFQQFLNNSHCKGLAIDKCKLKVAKSLFWIGGLGFNDYCPKFGVTSPIQSIMEKLIDFKITLMKLLLDKGAKHLIVQGLPPIGCFPLHMSLVASGEKDENGCARSANSVVKAHNDLLMKKLDEIKSQFPNSSIAYADFWKAFLTILKNPAQYGFSETFKACCGSTTGPYNFDLKCLCGSPGSSTCQDPSKFMSWDGFHPTEALHRKVAELFFHQDFCQPTFKQMISSVGKA